MSRYRLLWTWTLVEFILLSYPLLDLPALPEDAEGDDEAENETDPDG